MTTLSAIGTRQDWFAVIDGERVPCVHSTWTKTVQDPESYFDPGPKTGRKWEEFIAGLINGKRAILTNDKITTSESGSRIFKRLGYIALYDIHDVDVSTEGLRFEFGKKIADVVRGRSDQASSSRRPVGAALTPDEIYEAIDRYDSGQRPDRYREPTSWFLIDDRTGQSYPLKGIWALAANVPAALFNTSDAISGAKALNFEFADDEDQVTDAAALDKIANSDLPETTKKQLIDARIGQGKYRRNLEKIEKCCRVTGVSDRRLLRASHIKPWKLSDNSERLDGNNGLMLTPLFDHLFDRGYMSFLDDGRAILSKSIPISQLQLLGIAPNINANARSFSEAQRKYLRVHRRIHSIKK